MPSVILFRPTYDPNTRSTPTYPWALMYLASVLIDRGVDVTIVDEPCTPNSEERVKALLQEKLPVAVGITSMTGDQIRFGLAFAKLVRDNSKAAIVWGGIHPSLLPEQTAAHPLVDYLIAGEGEYAFADLVDCLACGAEPGGIAGLYSKRSGAVSGYPQQDYIDLATLPPLPYHLVDTERYICRRSDIGAERYFEVCTSRGCAHRCGFCYIECVHGSKWRSMDAEQAVARIKETVDRFKLDAILFREDNFFVNRNRVEAIARALIDQHVNVKWAASCRINYFAKYTPEFVDLLKRSGCVLLTFGVESGSDRVLDFIHKDIRVDMVRTVVQRVRDAGISGTYHFMGGFPTETREEFIETCRLIDQLRKLGDNVVVREMSIFAPYPGVSLVKECEKLGYQEPKTLEQWIDMDWANPSRPWLSEEQSRLISDAQFLIARLSHSNPLVRAYANARWRQLLNSNGRFALTERPLIDAAKGLLRRGHP